MPLNLVEICSVKFPDQIEAGNILFRKPDDQILIEKWSVPNIPKPTEDELLAESEQYELPYNLMTFMQLGEALVSDSINTAAQSRQYKNGVYCASYAQSTNPVWAAEAQAFIAWRDSMYVYALQVFADIQGGQPAPTQEEFVAGFPQIVWPI